MKYKYTFLKNRLFYDEILIPYLDRMSKKGWNLVSVNSFFKFEKSSQVYKYQVDYNPLTDDYLETLDHLGYEHVCCMQGNNGSIDNDPAAAMRYTEARLSPIASELLRDLDKDTVLMSLNFDDTEYEPTVLPAAYPNLLVNGSTGISAGYATDIPPHNLQEVIDATIHRIKYPHCHLDKLMEFIKGPDFPTGAIVEGLDGIKKAFEKGMNGHIAKPVDAEKVKKTILSAIR